MRLLDNKFVASALTAVAALCETRLHAQQFTRVSNDPTVNTLHSSYSSNWRDLNGDGKVDLLVGNCHTTLNGYYNIGNGAFEQITNGVLVASANDSSSVLIACLGRGTYPSVLSVNLAHPANDHLYTGGPNGAFTAATNFPSETLDGIGGAVFDLDRDGDVDLIILNETHAAQVFRNDGNGIFTRITSGNFGTNCCKYQSIATADFDLDGWVDFVVSSQSRATIDLFHNNHGQLELVPGVLQDTAGGAVGHMGITVIDYNNDGLPDFAVAGYPGGVDLYKNLGNLRFQRVSMPALNQFSRQNTAISAGDVNNDGYTDLFITGIQGNHHQLFLNYNGNLLKATNEPAINNSGGSGDSSSFASIKNDGQLALYVANSGPNIYLGTYNRSELYLNNGSTNGWVMFNVTGRGENPDAIGARVEVHATINGAPVVQSQEISQAAGWTSPNELRLHFGLGDARQIDEVIIHWPSGFNQRITNPDMRTIHDIKEPPVISLDNGGKISADGGDANFDVQASSDLKNWTTIGAIPSGGTFEDPNPANSQQFYRLVARP